MLDVRDRPRFTAEKACQVAQAHFGLQANAKPLPGERDQNFLLSRGGKASWVLKIANQHEQRDVLELQNQALAHLEQIDPTLTVPRVLPNLNGEGISFASGSGGEFMIRLFSYLEGVPLAKVEPHSPELLTGVGRFLGRVDKALLGFSHPAAHRPLLWSVTVAEQIVGQNLEWLTGAGRRSLVEEFLAGFSEYTQPRLGQLRQSIIHNDANDYNVLAFPDINGAQKVAGLLDFGDMIVAPLVYEAAVAAAYVMQSVVEPLDAAGQLVGGYHESLPLLADDFDVLFDLIAIRLCTTVTMAAKHSAQDPGRPYLTVSEEGAWRVLERLSQVDRSVATGRLRAACGIDAVPVASSDGRQELIGRRSKLIGPSLSLSYKEPLHIVRGRGQYLYTDNGQAYIDCVNNVAHVGHCHPKVVAAGQKQMALLNTNTRYLHDHMLHYAERLAATMPDPLSVCYFVCSGSEANELALRMARTYTGRRHMIVLEGAYHGNTATLIDHSPYKHDGPGGAGTPEHVRKAPMPDSYRGMYSGANAGERYASAVKEIVDELGANGFGPAGMLCEPVLGCGGQIVPPAGYLQQAFGYVSQAGGVCIADEVQVGFGRVGSHFWAFDSQVVVPDIVTLGKPIGNGHPLAAVITTPEIARAFANGMEYFNTFGGNPVSCAIGLAVLDVIEEEGLQQRALEVGTAMLIGLQQLMARHELIGDVRGLGLFIGVELVSDGHADGSAADTAALVVERMKERGILLSTDGPDHNVIKIKPPLVISEADASFIVHQLDSVLKSI